MKNNILLRVDCSEKLGWGHMFRCLGLAQELLHHGHVPIFLSQHNETLKRILRKQRMRRIWLNTDQKEPLTTTLICQRHFKVGTIILDLANADTRSRLQYYRKYVNELKRNRLKVIAFDGLKDEAITNKIKIAHDLTIVPYVGVQRDEFPITDHHYLFGEKYFVLRSELIKLAQRKTTPAQANKLLIALGGGKTSLIERKILSAIDNKLGKIQIKLTSYAKLTKHFHQAKSSQLTTIQIQTDPIKFYSWAEAAIVGSGLTKYEMAFLGIPSLSITTLNEHRNLMDSFVKYKTILHLGFISKTPEWQIQNTVQQILFDEKLRLELSQNGKKLIDGKGSKRLVEKFVKYGLLVV